MQLIQKVRCPHCGSEAKRHFCGYSKIMQTECQVCDYLISICSQSGKVIEAYTGGIPYRCNN